MSWEKFDDTAAAEGKPFGKFAVPVNDENLAYAQVRVGDMRAVMNNTATLEQRQRHYEAEGLIKTALKNAGGSVGYSNPTGR